jgi:hypothetical protein
LLAGAGVAALLALHYRCIYPRVRVWCFAPPGGLMSPAAAASLKDICYSLVSAKVNHNSKSIKKWNLRHPATATSQSCAISP